MVQKVSHYRAGIWGGGAGAEAITLNEKKTTGTNLHGSNRQNGVCKCKRDMHV